MKLTNTSLTELVTVTVGEDALPLINILKDKNNISEFKLAEMLNVTVNQIRNMLYRLNEKNLVNFMRKKDKKKGWYIYYWSLNKKSIEGAMQKVKNKQGAVDDKGAVQKTKVAEKTQKTIVGKNTGDEQRQPQNQQGNIQRRTPDLHSFSQRLTRQPGQKRQHHQGVKQIKFIKLQII